METKLLQTTSADLCKAAEIIRNGGLVAFPTETVYGLGANGLNSEAVAKIFQVKGRPNDNPLILHIAHIDQMEALTCEIPPRIHLLQSFIPGPITVVVKRSGIVPDVVTAGLDTVAVRIPEQPLAREFLSLCNVPVAAPSANLSGKPSPTKSEHVVNDLMHKIDGIIQGPDCKVGLESTVLDLSGEIPAVLRPGGVTIEQLRAVLGEVALGGSGERPKAPGMKYKHYAPKAPLYIVKGSMTEEIEKHQGKIGVLTVEESIRLEHPHLVLSLGNTPEEYAANLFARLRAFDDANVDIILSEDVKGDGICEAVRNRLYKAANNGI